MLTKLNRWVQSTIGVSRKEANAFIIFLPSMFLMVFSQSLYREWFMVDQRMSISESYLLDTLIAQAIPETTKAQESVALVNFDPNSASPTELMSVGIPKYIAERINQYRLKGGKFRVKSDLAKIYGFDSTLYQTLMPYIELPDKLEAKKIDKPKIDVRVAEYDINIADTTDLKLVRGIGSVLASRIIKYRQALGGFISSDQVNEVYGLDSLVILELKAFHISSGFSPEKIKINHASDQELDKHPYISLKQAKAIVTFRLQHGSYRSIDDLKQIKLLDARVIERIQPYISFE
jgi:competence protein ComEA